MDRLLHTERRLLRPLGPANLVAMHAMWIDAQVRKFLWDDEVIAEEIAAGVLETSAADFARNGFGLWAVHERATDELAGFCGLRATEHRPPEVLYGLLPAWWGRGLATEVGRAVLTYAFTTLSQLSSGSGADA